MTSIIQNNSNINNSNDHILTNTSMENDGNILPIDEKDFSTNNLSKIENANDEINFENAKPLKNIMIGNNKRRSARQFIEESQKVGTDYMTIPKKDKEKENENVQNKQIIKNKFENNDIKYKGKDFNFQSRRNKQPPHNNNNNNNENQKGKNQMKQIHLSKLLEEPSSDKKSNNNNNSNNNNIGGFLFGLESRRGHNNVQNNKNLPTKKVK